MLCLSHPYELLDEVLNKQREMIALDRQGTQQQTWIAYGNSTLHASEYKVYTLHQGYISTWRASKYTKGISICTFVYVPCIYLHVRWSYRRRSRSVVVSFVRPELLFPFVDSMQALQTSFCFRQQYEVLLLLFDPWQINSWVCCCRLIMSIRCMDNEKQQQHVSLNTPEEGKGDRNNMHDK